VVAGSLVAGEDVGAPPAGVGFHSPGEERELEGLALGNGVSVAALVEVEGRVGEEGGEEVSDITLATFALDIDADLADGIRGHVLLLWEEDDTEPVDLDEATITLGATAAMSGYLTAGKMYVPFGVFQSHFVSDPLVLELAETRKTALLAGWGGTVLTCETAVFSGALPDGDDAVDNVLFAAGISPLDAVRIGACWISDIGESGMLQELVEDRMHASPELDYDGVPGMGASLSVSVAAVVLDMEYIAATKDFAVGVLGDESLTPAAWNVELALHVGARWEVAAKVEGSRDVPDFPETQYGVAASIALRESLTFAAEYLHAEYGDGTEDRDMVTCYAGLEF
jgi:hypothetical protein